MFYGLIPHENDGMTMNIAVFCLAPKCQNFGVETNTREFVWLSLEALRNALYKFSTYLLTFVADTPV